MSTLIFLNSNSGLRMFTWIVSVHPYCVGKFTLYIIKCVLSNKMNNNRGDGHCYGFSDLAHSVTPIFLLIDHFFYWFSLFSKKRKKIYQLKVWIFCKIHHRILFFLVLCLSVQWSQMPLEWLSYVGNIWNYLCNRPTFMKYD